MEGLPTSKRAAVMGIPRRQGAVLDVIEERKQRERVQQVGAAIWSAGGSTVGGCQVRVGNRGENGREKSESHGVEGEVGRWEKWKRR